MELITYKAADLKRKGTTMRTEIMAGVTTFLAMAYILAVNPSILSASGMDAGAVFTATALSSAIATLVMGIIANLPFALAPGMGLNAFLAYTVVLGMGYSWQFALAAIFVEGIIFLLLTFFNVREAIVNSIPKALKSAISVGIGMFIAFIGMQNAGIVIDGATLVELGNITAPGPAMCAMLGLLITALLVAFNVKGALLIGIGITTLIGIPMGVTTYAGGSYLPPSLAPTFMKFGEGFAQIANGGLIDFIVIMFTFLFVDMFDTVGTLIGCATKSDLLKEDGSIPNCKEALFADAIGTTVGAILGTSTVTTFVESSTGVVEGGRTGVTAITTAVLFLASLFLAPLFLSIPSAATAPALILVGFYMMSPIKDIDWSDADDGIPAFLCIIMMVVCYSISDGIMFGILFYVIIKAIKKDKKALSTPTIVVALLFVAKIIVDALPAWMA